MAEWAPLLDFVAAACRAALALPAPPQLQATLLAPGDWSLQSKSIFSPSQRFSHFSLSALQKSDSQDETATRARSKRGAASAAFIFTRFVYVS